MLGKAYDYITGDEDARVCKDIPDESCNDQPRNFFAYLVSNVFTKIADELCIARIVFPWLIGALGAPAVFAGFLVPIREAGVLLPQLFVAAYIRSIAIRKWVWVVGGVLSAMAMLLITLSVNAVEGVVAGWVIIGLLTIYSLARGICSVSAKDVIGKTISKSRRGALMGTSASVAGFATMIIGLVVEVFFNQREDSSLFLMLLAGSVLFYLLSVLFFALIKEAPGATDGGGNAISDAIKSMGIIKSDKPFRRFLFARTLLLSIALAPPFYVLLAQQNGVELSGLGILIIASGLASMVSAPIWGKLSDRSSRQVMALSALLTGVLGVAVSGMALTDIYSFDHKWDIAVMFFLIATFHGGARLGRKTYLVDMANADNRSTYVAVSNTFIGLFMLAAGGVGWLGDIYGVPIVIGVLAVVALAGSFYILRIEEVSEGE